MFRRVKGRRGRLSRTCGRRIRSTKRVEQIVAVLRARARPRGGAAPRRPACPSAAGRNWCRRTARRGSPRRSAGRVVAVHGEAVVHRDDLHLAGGEVLHRMVGAVVALVHLLRLGAERQASIWWPRQMPNIGMPEAISFWISGTAYLPVAAGSPGPFDRKTPSGLSASMSSAVRRRRHDRDLAAGAGQAAQDVALDAVVDGDDVELRRCSCAAVAFAPHPGRLVPGVALAGRDVRARGPCRRGPPRLGLGLQRAISNLPAGSWAITPFGMPCSRIRRSARGCRCRRGR